MKTLKVLFIVVTTMLSIHVSANTYYASPSGSDSNPGTMSAPFATWEKLGSVLRAGDIGYVRGGTYRINKSSSSSNLSMIQNLNGSSGNLISIFAYPGEDPVLDLSNTSWNASGVFGFIVSNCSYLHIKGLRVTGLPQNSNGNATALWYVSACNNLTIENCEADHGMYGFQIKNTTNSLFLNCDAHHLQDPYTSPAYEGSNGFDVTGNNSSTNITFRGCRAYWCCDDGFDLYNSDGFFTFEDCWSFRNGYVPGTYNKAGNGWGFKLGPNATDKSSTFLRDVKNCIAFQNRTGGFDQNSGRCIVHLYNNTSWKNGNTGFNFCSDIDKSINYVFKNNVSYEDPNAVCSTSAWIQSNNSWNGITPTSSSFASTDTTGVSRKRGEDGALPDLKFLHLAAGSNLIDKGISVGLSFLGATADLGAFEYSSGGGQSTSNKAPVAVAGSSQVVILPLSLALLDGSKSSDADGNITSYRWRQISGPSTALLLTPILVSTSATTLKTGEYKFELKVTDNDGDSGLDTVSVIVKSGSGSGDPVADAGNSQTILLPKTTATLNGSESWDDGNIKSYEWNQIVGPMPATISSASSQNTTVSDLQQGTYRFELTVTDNENNVSKDTVQVLVKPTDTNAYPDVDAGGDKTISVPSFRKSSSVKLNLIGAADDPDGSVVSYEWTKISGPTCTIITPERSETVITDFRQGGYLFEFKAEDNDGAVSRDTVSVLITRDRETSIATQTAEIKAPMNQAIAAQGTAKVSLYPNPATDNFTLDINSEATGQMSVQIVDQGGAIKRTVAFNKNQQLDRVNVAVKDLPAGVYFARIQIGNWLETKKFVKM